MTADVVPSELLEIPSPQERRRLDRDLCAGLLDRLLRRLARQEALCRRVFGHLARHFLAKRAHQRLGFVRLDDFARERLGLSGRELQELARVAQRLEALPALARAFAQGALSWSHLRLLVSVATPDTEAAWLARARGESVRALEAAIAVTRGVPPDPDERAVDGESPGRFRLRCPRRGRRLWHHATELASRMSGARLPAWRAAEAIAAEGLASQAADAVAQSDPPQAPTRRDAAPPLPPGLWEAIAEALPEPVDRLTLLADTANPYQLDARLRAAVRALQRIDFQTGRLLRLVAQLRLHRAFGVRAFPDYVRERLGCSLRKARALLALDRRLGELPALAAAYRDGALSFARALVLLPVVHPDRERAPRHRDPIFERDGWRCAVPACTARASLHDHHVLYRSRGGDHARNNRVAICAAHHLNGIHRFRIRVEGVAPHDLTWQLGVRRGRPPLMVTHGDRYLQA